MEVFANGILDIVAEFISNVIGYQKESNPEITLKEAITTGLDNSQVDDSFERYGIETIFRLLEQANYDNGENLDIYRKSNTEKVFDICINYYRKVFLNASIAYPGITVNDFMENVDDYELDDLSERETELTSKQIIKILREHEKHVNVIDW
jgi:hypothetical protein